MDHIVFIGIGSNLGARLDNCKAAVEKLKQCKDVTVSAVSNWHEGEALTIKEEKAPSYINGVAKIITCLLPHDLLIALKTLENEMGRSPNHAKWAPRVIDLDILFYDDAVIFEKGLSIPHPEIPKRIFVLKPMCDIEPGLIHPSIKKTMRELYEEI